ncbi:MAG: hypothetical protein Fur0037_19980 [Planctomycetota bacterium]
MLLPSVVPAQEVTWWQKDLPSALAAAGETKARMVLLYCWRDGHEGCKAMFSGTLSEKSVMAVMNDFLCMAAKTDQPDGKAVQEKYGVDKLPVVLFLKPDGSVVDAVAGYVPVEQFKEEVSRILAGKGTVEALRAEVEKAPKDLVLKLRLANKLRATGDRKGASAVLADQLALDPKFRTEAGAEARLLQIYDETFKPEIAPQDYDLKALKEFLVRQKQKRILFLGYDKIAAVEYMRGDLKAACEAAVRAWKNIPKDQILDWGQNIASKAYLHHKDLDRSQLKLALEISKKALAEVEARCKEKPDPAFLANALYLHASVQIVNNLRKDAFASMQQAIELNPTDDNLKKALDRWKSGAK